MTDFKNKGSYYFSQEEMELLKKCMKQFIPDGNTFPTMSKLLVYLMDTMSNKIVNIDANYAEKIKGTDSLLLENEELKAKVAEIEKGMNDSNTKKDKEYETAIEEMVRKYEDEKIALQARINGAEKLLNEKSTIRLGAGEVIINLPDTTIFKIRKVRKFAKEKGFIKTDDPTEFIDAALLEFLRVHFYNIVNID